MSSLARTAVPAGRPAPSRGARPALRVVAAPLPRRGRSVFVVLLSTVLGLGLVALLGLNTSLAQDAFQVSSLKAQRGELAVTEQRLNGLLSQREDPQRLAMRAEALGMKPSGPPLFLRLPDGKILGDRTAQLSAAARQ